MKQMICVSNSAWHGLPSRTAQLAGRLKNYRVLYIDPDQPSEARGSANAKRDWKGDGEQIGKSLTILAAPPQSKAARRGGFWGARYQRRLARYLAARMKDYAFEKPVLWLTDPASADLIGRFPHGAVVFDCQEMPDLENVHGTSQRRAKQIEKLARSAKVVLTQSEGTRKAVSQWNPDTLLVPNAVDFELFQRARDGALPFPNDLFTVKNPIFGHIGALGDHLDLSFIEQAAAAHPDWSFVFVGECPDTEGVRRIRQYKNVHLLGVKPQKQLPMYLCRFDVCVSLYKSNELSRDISPMKLYEYLASGKPIVSTPQPAQTLDYSDVVYIAGTAGEWTEACRKAYIERDAWKVRQRISYAQASSWDARIVDVERILTEKDVFS